MKVVWREGGRTWVVAGASRYRDEAHLQQVLVDNPDLIPFDDISTDLPSPCVMLPEVGLPGSGHSDIVGIDAQGGITVIECKLASNPEIKRKVVGQVLEYAAFLWRKPYPFLNEIAQQRLGCELAEKASPHLSAESASTTAKDDFIAATETTLRDGTFRLVIAVDGMNEELRRTIEYLAQGPSQLSIFALELAYFTGGQSEILVPRLHGTLARVEEEKLAKGPRWDKQRFFDDARQRGLPETVILVLEDLLAFCEADASRVFWGTGRQTGSFTFHHIKDSRAYSIFSAFSDGTLMFSFGYLRDRVRLELLSEYLRRLRDTPGIRELRARDDFNSWPSIRLADTFKSVRDLDRLKTAVRWIRDSIDADVGP